MVVIDPSQIPIIDFKRLATDFDGVAADIKQTASTWGFLYIKNHDLEQSYIDRMRDIADTFFNHTDAAEKWMYPWDSIQNAGYDNKTGTETYFTEHGKHDKVKAGDPKEGFVFRKENSYKQPLPPTLQRYNEEIQGFMRLAHEKIALKVLACLSLAMGLPRDYLPALHVFDRPSYSSLRLLHYPGLDGDDADVPVRLAAHTDHTVITMLFQHDIPGLQIRPPNLTGPVMEGERWLDAPVIPGAVLINIGETMTFLSGGLLKSTLHRVAKSPRPEDRGKSRYSTVYFCHANEDTPLEMLPGVGGERKEPPVSCVTGEKVRTVKEWIQHRHSRGRLLPGQDKLVQMQKAY